jgi:hypothetical protein
MRKCDEHVLHGLTEDFDLAGRHVVLVGNVLDVLAGVPEVCHCLHGHAVGGDHGEPAAETRVDDHRHRFRVLRETEA